MRKPVYAICEQQRRRLAFDVRCLDSIIPLVSISEISRLYLASAAEQAGLSLPWSQTPKTGFLATRHILFYADSLAISKHSTGKELSTWSCLVHSHVMFYLMPCHARFIFWMMYVFFCFFFSVFSIIWHYRYRGFSSKQIKTLLQTSWASKRLNRN